MASRGVNKVILLGNLGQDPEIRSMPNSGELMATFSVATSETWRDRNTGEQKEKTEWHRVVVFGKLAEIVQQYVRKGSQVYVEGQLQTRKWQDQNGIERYSTEVVISGFNGSFQMVGGRQQTSGGYEASNLPNNTGGQNNYQPNPMQNMGNAMNSGMGGAMNQTTPANPNIGAGAAMGAGAAIGYGTASSNDNWDTPQQQGSFTGAGAPVNTPATPPAGMDAPQDFDDDIPF